MSWWTDLRDETLKAAGKQAVQVGLTHLFGEQDPRGNVTEEELKSGKTGGPAPIAAPGDSPANANADGFSQFVSSKWGIGLGLGAAALLTYVLIKRRR